MTNQKRYPITIRNSVAHRRVFAGLLLGGGLASAALLLTPRNEPTISEAPIVSVQTVTPPSVIVERALEVIDPAETTTIEAKGSKVESERPQLAIAHEDRDTDFLAQAEGEVETGDLDEAFVSLRRHLYVREPTSEVLLNIGRIGRQVGEHAIAEQALLDAVAMDPANVDIEVELARVLLEVGELTEARMHARQAIRLNADDALAWNIAGRVAMAQSEWSRAEATLRRSLELEPMNAMVHNNLGLLYVHTRRANDAVDSLETAVELFGETVPHFAYNNLGLAHEMAGNLEEAKSAFEEALMVLPTYARATVNLKRVVEELVAIEESDAYQTASAAELAPAQ